VTNLLSKLSAGQTGCLLGGTFSENLSIRNGGQPGNPITLTSAPNTRATIAGIVWIADSANDLVIADLNLNGTNGSGTPNPQINGDRITLRGNDITNNHSGICIVLGGSFPNYGRADGAVIDGNRIHDCGRLPATNHDHGIYIEGSTGSRVVNNVFYGNADWGIHLYPDANNTYIAHNIVDGNGKGLIFAGESAGGEYASAYASDNNTVEYNIISGSTLGYNAEAWWGGPVGTGNVLRNNCLWTPSGASGLDTSGGGFTASNNLTANPQYVDAANHDYRLQSGSPCAAMAPAA
jgi:parallel beta-helix repeat protein